MCTSVNLTNLILKCSILTGKASNGLEPILYPYTHVISILIIVHHYKTDEVQLHPWLVQLHPWLVQQLKGLLA